MYGTTQLDIYVDLTMSMILTEVPETSSWLLKKDGSPVGIASIAWYGETTITLTASDAYSAGVWTLELLVADPAFRSQSGFSVLPGGPWTCVYGGAK